MRKFIVSIITIATLATVTACGQTATYEVTPLDDGTPVPQCVTIDYYNADNWDGEQHGNVASIYCLKEN